MARRTELQGIANALNRSFVSRNNDFRGYWSIGQLKSFTIDSGLTSMRFFLTRHKACSPLNLQNYIAHHYAGMLENLLMKQRLPNFWVSEASILINFDLDAEHTRLCECLTSGEPFQSHCQITDDFGHDYFSVIYGRCLSHSATQELKSARKLSM